MGAISKQASSYVKTGSKVSDINRVERGYFRDMKTTNIIFGSIAELYRRYSTELWAFATFGTWAVIIWNKLG